MGEGRRRYFFAILYDNRLLSNCKKKIAVFFQVLPQIITAIRSHGLEAEKQPNIAVEFHFL